MRRHATGRSTPPGSGWIAPLTDVLVHAEDVRGPARPHCGPDGVDVAAGPRLPAVPAEARPFVVGRTLGGCRFETTDDGWAHGSGDELLGPASALALAVLGGRGGLAGLAGAGVARLTA